jgi:hypothetical protein
MLLLHYNRPNNTLAAVSLSADCTGFITDEDAEQLAEGLRREFRQEPTLAAVAGACLGLAHKRRYTQP